MIQSRAARRIITSVFAVIAILAFLSFLLQVLFHIQQGHGADTYDNVYGLHLTWAQAAASMASLVLLLVGAWVVRWWQLRKRSRQEGVSAATILEDLRRNP